MTKMTPPTCTVLANWDHDGNIWMATSHDVPGLMVTAADKKTLVKKLQLAIADLMAANKIPVKYEFFTIDYIKRGAGSVIALRKQLWQYLGAAAAWMDTRRR